MESLVLFYDNALIYSPNVFFISLILLLSFIILLIGNGFYLFVKEIRNTAEYIIEVQKKRKKTKHNRINVLFKRIFVVFTVISRKKARINNYTKKTLNAIKEEVFIKEGEQI